MVCCAKYATICETMKIDFGSALQVYDTAVNKTDQVARRLASGELRQLERDVVELTVQESAVKVATSLVRTEDEMLGTIVDLKA